MDLLHTPTRQGSGVPVSCLLSLSREAASDFSEEATEAEVILPFFVEMLLVWTGQPEQPLAPAMGGTGGPALQDPGQCPHLISEPTLGTPAGVAFATSLLLPELICSLALQSSSTVRLFGDGWWQMVCVWWRGSATSQPLRDIWPGFLTATSHHPGVQLPAKAAPAPLRSAPALATGQS